MSLSRDTRPWGIWEVLEERPDYKLKKMQVLPGHRLSYQKHKHRKEHWVVAQGEATVTIDGKVTKLKVGESIDILPNVAHRVANELDVVLMFFELQTGSYFGEDDIERLEDDYGRV